MRFFLRQNDNFWINIASDIAIDIDIDIDIDIAIAIAIAIAIDIVFYVMRLFLRQNDKISKLLFFKKLIIHNS